MAPPSPCRPTPPAPGPTPRRPWPTGPHTVAATATDAAGNTTTDTVAFTVDTVAPAIAITAPADGSTTNDATPAITGTSDVLSGTITLVIDGGAPDHRADRRRRRLDLHPGHRPGRRTAHRRRHRHRRRRQHHDRHHRLRRRHAAPAIAITAPADGSSTNDTTPAITGTSDVLSGTIQLVIDGGAPVTVTTDAAGDWTHTPATLADGPHTVVATATDAAGNTTTDTSTFTVDTTAPVIAITAPADGSTTNDADPDHHRHLRRPLRHHPARARRRRTRHRADRRVRRLDPHPRHALADGPHTVVVTATDAAGNTADDESTFTVAAVAADVTITSPDDGSSTTDPTPVVTGTTTPGGTVLVSVDGGSRGRGPGQRVRGLDLRARHRCPAVGTP